MEVDADEMMKRAMQMKAAEIEKKLEGSLTEEQKKRRDENQKAFVAKLEKEKM